MSVPGSDPVLRAIPQAQQGERRAFDVLYKEYQAPVQAWCLRLLGSQSEAEQIAQDVFVQAWECLPEFRGDCPVKNWLFQIARNRCLNLLRTKKGQEAVGGQSLEALPVVSQTLAGPRFEGDVVQSIFVSHLLTLIQECAQTAPRPWDPFDTDIFHLLYEEGVETAREVAKRLGRPEGTVKYRIYHHIDPVLACVRARLQAEDEAI